MIAPLLREWMQRRGWTPLPFQEETWQHACAGRSGLIHAPTGAGKTLAAFLGPLTRLIADSRSAPFQILWMTPLRALAMDTLRSLSEVVDELRLTVTVGLRTGDTSSAERQRQRRKPPTVLVTTPESLTLLLSDSDAPTRFAHVRAVIVDEWHELLGSKRGVQTELALARIRTLSPGVQTWGLSATIGNLVEAHDVLLGATATSARHLVALDIGVETAPTHEPPFVWSHEPRASQRGYGVSGHLHPTIRLPGVVRGAVPCFWFTPRYAVLPAFGAFTGGHRVRPGPHDRIYVCGPDAVVEV